MAWERRGKEAKERRYAQLNFKIDRPGIVLLSSTGFYGCGCIKVCLPFPYCLPPRLLSISADNSLQNIRENKTFRVLASVYSPATVQLRIFTDAQSPVSRRITFFDVIVVTLKYTSKILFSSFETSIEKLHDARELRELDSILIDKLKFVHREVTFQMKIDEIQTRGHSLYPC